MSESRTAYINECIGPRTPGVLWSDGYGNTIRVLGVNRSPARGLWEITEVDEAGQQVGMKRTHCTPWDYDRNRVLEGSR